MARAGARDRSIERFLIDTSAFARRAHPAVHPRLAPLFAADLITTCAVTDLEALFSARSALDYDAMAAERLSLEDLEISQPVFKRALFVQRQLSRRGQHRISLIDLVIAATAELHDVAVLHYDADYERIAAVTGQRHQWVAPRGSL